MIPLGPQARSQLESCQTIRVKDSHLFRNHEHKFILRQLQRAVALLGHLDMNRFAPFGHDFNFDQRARGIDVLNARLEMTATVGMTFDLERMWANVNYVTASPLVHVRLAIIDAAVKKIYVPKKVVNERRSWMVVNLVG